MPLFSHEAWNMRSTSMLAGTWYMYGEPSGSVALVGHRQKPQPCLAVSTASDAPSAWMEAIQLSVSSAEGANDAGSLAPAQFRALHDGSPLPQNVP